jgi:putative ABC transport system permease protein
MLCGLVNNPRRGASPKPLPQNARPPSIEPFLAARILLGMTIRIPRLLSRNPGVALVAVGTLALAIGTAATLFAALDAVLWRPLPFLRPGGLVALCESNPGQGWDCYAVSLADFYDWRRQNSSFEELAACAPGGGWTLSGSELPERLQGAFCSAGLFPMLGVKPELGRLFRPEEDQRDHARVLIISHNCWRRRFGSDPGVAGKPVTLDGRNYTIAGVLPAGFRLDSPATVTGIPAMTGEADLWRPLTVWPEALKWRSTRDLLVMGRLKDGASLARAQSEFGVISGRLASEFPDSNGGWRARLIPWRDLTVAGSRPMLLAAMGAALFTLLIACANTSGFLLARTAGRRREFAVKLALGASRWRLARQAFFESGVLAALGAGLGIALAPGGIKLVQLVAPPGVPRLGEAAIDARLAGAAAAMGIVAAFGCGLGPAWLAARSGLSGALEVETRAGEERRGSAAQNLLVIIQTALAFTLLDGAGLMLHSLWKWTAARPGFDVAGLAAFDFAPSGPRYSSGPACVRFADELLARARTLPGARGVAVAWGLPFGRMTDADVAFDIQGAEPPGEGARRVASLRQVSAGYFEVMRIPVLRGRGVEARDTSNAPPVVVVNEAFAKRYFGGDDPLGRSVASPDLGEGWREIAGVVANVAQTGYDTPPRPEIYQPYAQGGMWQFSLVCRTTAPLGALFAALKKEVAAVDRGQTPFNGRMVESDIAAGNGSRRFVAIAVGGFGALSLLGATFGLQGLLAYGVSRQTREIGVRMALGARREDILRMIAGRGMFLTMIGLVAGAGGAMAITRLLASQLFAVGRVDPLALGGAAAALWIAALLACAIPARRAAAVDPARAMR